jgi:hypothetical protein
MTEQPVSGSNIQKTRRERPWIFVLFAVTVGVYAAFVIVATLNTHHRIGLGGAPLFYDFGVFYQAAAMADAGHAADAYDDGKMIAAVQQAFPGSTLRLPWNYPPAFQLLLMPLGALPFVAAWIVWSCVLLGLYAPMAHRLVSGTDHFWFLLLAPGVAVNLFFSQNGLLTATLMGAGVLLLKRRPLAGGVLLGLLAYKPQFAILAPFALIAGREWRALAAAIISQAALSLLAWAALGTGPWLDFLHKIVAPAAIFSSSSSDWRSIPSIMIMTRSLGFGAEASAICHWTVAAAAAAGALWIWRTRQDGKLRAAALATATLLVTPYLRGYDVVLLVLPVAFLLEQTRRLVQNAIIFFSWISPAFLMFVPTKIQLWPALSIMMMIAILAANSRNLWADAGINDQTR